MKWLLGHLGKFWLQFAKSSPIQRMQSDAKSSDSSTVIPSAAEACQSILAESKPSYLERKHRVYTMGSFLSESDQKNLLASLRDIPAILWEDSEEFEFTFVHSNEDWRFRSLDGYAVELNSRVTSTSTLAVLEYSLILDMVFLLNNWPSNANEARHLIIYGEQYLRTTRIQAHVIAFQYLKKSEGMTFADFVELTHSNKESRTRNRPFTPMQMEEWLGIYLSVFVFDRAGRENQYIIPTINVTNTTVNLSLTTFWETPVRTAEPPTIGACLVHAYHLAQFGHYLTAEAYRIQVTALIQNLFHEYATL